MVVNRTSLSESFSKQNASTLAQNLKEDLSEGMQTVKRSAETAYTSLKGKLNAGQRTVADNVGQFKPTPGRNYLLQAVQFVDETTAPAPSSFMKLSPSERAFVLAFVLFFTWIPLLLMAWTLVPALVVLTVAFYVAFFDVATLQTHVDEVAVQYTGKGLAEGRGLVIEAFRSVLDYAVLLLHNLLAGNYAAVRRMLQTALACGIRTLIVALEASISGIRLVQDSIAPVAGAQAGPQTADEGSKTK